MNISPASRRPPPTSDPALSPKRDADGFAAATRKRLRGFLFRAMFRLTHRMQNWTIALDGETIDVPTSDVPPRPWLAEVDPPPLTEDATDEFFALLELEEAVLNNSSRDLAVAFDRLRKLRSSHWSYADACESILADQKAELDAHDARSALLKNDAGPQCALPGQANITAVASGSRNCPASESDAPASPIANVEPAVLRKPVAPIKRRAALRNVVGGGYQPLPGNGGPLKPPPRKP